MKYWFSHLPKAAGVHDSTGRVNNWWKYAFDWTNYKLDGTPIVAPPTGDTNGDGVVNLDDLNNVRNNFGGAGLGDTNDDGIVDLVDLNAVRNNFGATAGAPVPEPHAWQLASMMLGGIVLAAAVKRRSAFD